MTKTKKSELRNMSKEQLEGRIIEVKKELVKINTQLSTGTTPENPGRIKQVKKEIARMLTILTEKEKTSKEESKKQ
jgi:large subunit ribosomal protein L29